jgi:hypothetical protein
MYDVATLGDKKMTKKTPKKILKYEYLTMYKQRLWNVKTSNTNNNMSNWNHLKIIQKIYEQYTGKT